MKIVSMEKKVDIGLLEKRFKNHWAQISTNQLLRIKNSIKDVARSTWNEVPYEIEALCKTIPDAPQGIEDINFLFGYKGEDEKEVDGIFKTHKGLQEYAAKYPEQWEKVKRLLSTMRAKSRHAAAVIITNRPVNEFIPTMEIGGVRATQYTMKACESSGAIKMDFLTLNTLNDIALAIKLVQKKKDFWTRADQTIGGKRVPAFRVLPHNGENYDIWDLPSDQNVFNTISEGDTETVFQVGTSSAKKWLKEFNYFKAGKEDEKLIDSVESIAVFTALDRPGPLDAIIEKDGISRNMLQEYASRLRGDEPLDPIEFLSKEIPLTQGVITFQEDLERIYKLLTDCTGVEADQFRDKIGKKKMAEVLKAYPNFMEKVIPKFGEETAQKLWDQIYTFGQYGFGKAHSTTYSMTAYVCAFLKYHYPLEWWTAVLSNADKKKIKEKLWAHCKDLITLPDVRFSGNNFTIKEDKIVAPLSMLQGVGVTAHEELMTCGPYESIKDFCNKMFEYKKKKGTYVIKTKIIKPAKKLSKEILDNTEDVVIEPEEKVVEEKVFKAGRSALTRGVVNKLIVSGVADSLFPEGLDLVSKLELFEKELAESHGKKRPDKIDPKYRDINSLDIYQLRKQILEVYSSYIPPSLYDLKVEGVHKRTIKLDSIQSMDTYSYYPEDPKTIGHILESMGKKTMPNGLTFVNGKLLKYMNEDATLDDGRTLRVVVGAYVNDIRKFDYVDKKSGKRVDACEIILDIDGEILKTVKWPDRTTKRLTLPEGDLKDSIVIAILSRWKSSYPFGLDALIKVKEPLIEKSEE